MLIEPVLCRFEIRVDRHCFALFEFERALDSFPTIQRLIDGHRVLFGHLAENVFVQKLGHHLAIDAVHSLDFDRCTSFEFEVDEVLIVLFGKLLERALYDFAGLR